MPVGQLIVIWHKNTFIILGTESSESLLEAYGIITKDNIPINTLNPKLCPNCNEGNTQDAKFCAKCRMVLRYDAYEDTVSNKQERHDDVDFKHISFTTLLNLIWLYLKPMISYGSI